LLWKNLLILLP
jgi:hypothetical protein